MIIDIGKTQKLFDLIGNSGNHEIDTLYAVRNISVKQQIEWFRQGYFSNYKYFVDFKGNRYTRGEK